MTVTALFATSGATNAGLYPAAGRCEEMVSKGQFPPPLGRRLGARAPAGIVLTAAIVIVLAVGFDLSSIASIGSAIALCVFTLITAAHLRAPRVPDIRARARQLQLVGRYRFLRYQVWSLISDW